MMLGVWRSACDPNYVQEWTEEEKVIQDDLRRMLWTWAD
jgi:hypothetical protein